MKKTIAYVDGKPVYSYKSNKCICGGDCRDIYVDKTTGNKYIINIDNGQIVVDDYVEESSSGSNSDVVGSAIVGQAHAH